MHGPGRYVLVVGNIGAGKSTLAGTLAQRLALVPHPEPFEGNPFLDSFYAEPAAYAFRSQLWFLIAHHRQHQALDAAGVWSIKDGSLFDSAEIVTRRMHERGFLSAPEWSLYSRLYEALSASCTSPSMILYLSAEPEVLLARVQRRARDFEREIDVEFLAALNGGYDAWVKAWRRSPVLTIDTSRLNAAAVADAATAPVEAMLRGALDKR